MQTEKEWELFGMIRELEETQENCDKARKQFEELESCNFAFKALLIQNAGSFQDIQKVFEDFDATLSHTKEVN